MGVQETTVSRQRRIRGIDIRVERWRGVDWNCTNQDIADEIGVTIEAVKYQRVKAGLKAAAHKEGFGSWRNTRKLIGLSP